jgi:hypothetical protein
MRFRVALVLLALAGCPVPQQRPTILDGGPDLFTGQIFNCRMEVVATERDSAMVDVKRCLLGQDTVNPSPPTCLVAQAAQYKPDTVACVARDLGASSNAAVVSGMATDDEKTMAGTARAWISRERLGYR